MHFRLIMILLHRLSLKVVVVATSISLYAGKSLEKPKKIAMTYAPVSLSRKQFWSSFRLCQMPTSFGTSKITWLTLSVSHGSCISMSHTNRSRSFNFHLRCFFSCCCHIFFRSPNVQFCYILHMHRDKFRIWLLFCCAQFLLALQHTYPTGYCLQSELLSSQVISVNLANDIRLLFSTSVSLLFVSLSCVLFTFGIQCLLFNVMHLYKQYKWEKRIILISIMIKSVRFCYLVVLRIFGWIEVVSRP